MDENAAGSVTHICTHTERERYSMAAGPLRLERQLSASQGLLISAHSPRGRSD
ncbi:Eukaryotic peptide chain release factor subunit 1 [Clarias magur]|uniref:Eukaryotic peptide chain release factor subunit 1 n=1 Tax=Clarias magur TaxID=1594786 RepID=A0A8J4XCZ2_CLAMG|nr:Eukaryotic peptide chain release factor subunit 1 [Clarias magur]